MRSALALALLVFTATAVQAQTVTGRVVAVHDGDTISIRTTASTIRVRLAGIDCPEARQPYSARAKRFTSQMVFGKTVSVRGEGQDRYDRLLGRVLVDGVDVNEALVRNGLAWHYQIGAGDRRLAEAEKAARAARVGLWADADPIPPWRWRRADRGAEAPPPRTPQSGRRFSSDNTEAVASGSFHGNVRSRVFHRPGCRNYDCRNCVEVFATAAAAEAAGFRPAGDCMR